MRLIEEILDEIKEKAEKRAQKEDWGTWKTRVENEMGPLREMRQEWDGLVDFIRSAKVVTKTPKVRRRYSERNGHVKVGSGRGIHPQVFLVSGKRTVCLDGPDGLETSSRRHGIVEHHMPKFSLTLAFRSYGVWWTAYGLEIVEAFYADCGGALQTLDGQVKAEWRRVEENADRVLREHLKESAPAERKKLVKKLQKALMKSPGLTEIPVEALFAVFRLGHKEIGVLKAFVMRNKADLDIAGVDEIRQAQKLAKVAGVMDT